MHIYTGAAILFKFKLYSLLIQNPPITFTFVSSLRITNYVILRRKFLRFVYKKCSGINIINCLTHQCRLLWIINTTTMRTYNNATADPGWARCKQWTRDRDRDRGPMHWPREQRTWVMQSTTGSTTPDVIQAINPPRYGLFCLHLIFPPAVSPFWQQGAERAFTSRSILPNSVFLS